MAADDQKAADVTCSVFSEADAEVMRNSLPLRPCVGGGSEVGGRRWSGMMVESH